MDRGRDDRRDQAAKVIIRQLLAAKGAPIRVKYLKRHFPNVNTASICAFIDGYPNNFERYEDGQGRFVKLKTNISLCQTHCSKRTCSGQIPYCSGLHVCKFYILSKCGFTGNCAFGHDLTTTHNKKLLHANFLEDASAADICFLLRNADNRSDVLIPKVCKFYNVKSGCQRKNCSNLHVCKHYIQGECKFNTGCRRSHNLTDSSVQNILQKHGIDTKRSPKEVLADLQGMMVKAVDGTRSSGSSSGGRLTMNDEMEIADSLEHVTLRTAKRNQSRSQANLALFDQGARPKTATATRNQSRSQANLAFIDQGVRPKTATAGNQPMGNMMKSKAESVPNLQHAISMERESNSWICMYHLCGTCMYKQRCFNAHYDLPYQWMYKSKTAKQWKVFGVAGHNLELEITYCDPQNDKCYLDFGDGVIWDVDFKTMTTKGGKYEVKRLSTKSNSEDELHPLATLWRWYWRDQMGNWREYGEADRGYTSSITSCDIEQEYLARPTGQMIFVTQGHEYVLDFREMVQKNVSYKTRREVVRRPEFVDEQTFQQKKRSACNRKKTKGDQMEGSDQEELVPPTWGDVEGDLMDHCQIVPLHKKRSQREFSEIERLFFKSMPNTFTITSIMRVENGDLWLSFLNKKKKMKKRNPTKDVKELQLFHGTSSEYYHAICRQGFDFRLSGTSTGTLYGKGSYFAETAKYSDAYAKSSDRLMFVVRVLVGEYTKGESKFVRPPSKDPSNRCSDLYDSCVDDVSNPKIFVIFDNSGQVYPEYVIKYTNTL